MLHPRLLSVFACVAAVLLTVAPSTEGGFAVIAMDQQIDIGLGHAILPDDQTPDGLDRITFENEGGIGFTRMHLVKDNGMNGYYDGPFVNLVRTGIGAVDFSAAGSRIEFDARYFQSDADYPPGTPWDQHDAPIAMVLVDGTGNSREYLFPYHSMWGDLPYPTWTHVTVDINASPTPKINILDFGVDLHNIVEIRFTGTDWPGTGDDFVDFKQLRLSAVPLPSSLLLATIGLATGCGISGLRSGVIMRSRRK